MQAQIGEVRECKHCNGAGRCNCYSCIPGEFHNESNTERTVHEANKHGPFTCNVCEGAGSMWIGPKTVHIHTNK